MRGLELSWSQILDLATDELEDIARELESEVYTRMRDLEENNLTNVPAYANYGNMLGVEFEKTTQADMARRESILIRISMARQFLTDSTSTVTGAKTWAQGEEFGEGVSLDWQAHSVLSDFYEGENYQDSDLWRAIGKAHRGDMSLSELLDKAAELFERAYPQFTHHWVPGQGEFYNVE